MHTIMYHEVLTTGMGQAAIHYSIAILSEENVTTYDKTIVHKTVKVSITNYDLQLNYYFCKFEIPTDFLEIWAKNIHGLSIGSILHRVRCPSCLP